MEQQLLKNQQELKRLQTAEEQAKNYLSLAQKPFLKPNGYLKTIQQEVFFGILFGAIFGLILTRARKSWQQKNNRPSPTVGDFQQ